MAYTTMEFSRPEYCSGEPFPSPGDLPNAGIKPRSPALQVSLPAEPPGKPKNTGVSSLSLLQRIFPTQESNQGLLHCRQILYQLNYQGRPSLSLNYTVQGILQARTVGWVTIPFSRGSSQPRDRTQVSRIAGRFFTSWATRKSNGTGAGSLSLLQGIFPNHESNQRLLHCRQILYQLSYQGRPSQ